MALVASMGRSVVALLCLALAASVPTDPPQLNISWTQVNKYLAPARRLAATLTSLDTQVVLFGGDSWACPVEDARCNQPDFRLRAVPDPEKLWAYDTVNKAWFLPKPCKSCTSLPSSRSGHAAARTDSRFSDRTMLIHGGHMVTDESNQYLDDLWLYDIGNADIGGQWKCLTGSACDSSADSHAIPSGRMHHILEGVPGTAQYVLYGGQTCESNHTSACSSDEVWSLILSGSVSSPAAMWVKLEPSHAAAPALFGHGSAYHLGFTDITSGAVQTEHSGLFVFGGVSATGAVTGAVTRLQANTTTYEYEVIQHGPPRSFHSLEGSSTGIFSLGGYASKEALQALEPDGSLLTYTIQPTGNFSLSQFNGSIADGHGCGGSGCERGYASAALVRGNVVDSLIAFGGNMNGIPYEFGDMWMYVRPLCHV